MIAASADGSSRRFAMPAAERWNDRNRRDDETEDRYMPDVSVILPTYNRAEWLAGTVRSILGQTYAPVEVLIVDDGSSDDTAAVCGAFPPPVRYLRQENGGVSAARNRGIREARGEWIALADSDDLWERHKLEVQLAALAAAPDARWCASGCTVIDEQDRPIPGRQGFERVFAVFGALDCSPDAWFSRWLDRYEVEVAGRAHTCFHGDYFELLFHGNVVLPSSAVIHRDLFDDAGTFDEEFRVAEETEFFHRAAVGNAGVMVMSSLVGYRVALAGSLTNAANTPRLMRHALTSLERAAALRGRLSRAERAAYQEGRGRLLRDLAYAELSLLNRPAARDAARAAWQAGADRNAGLLALFAASLLPVPLLRGLHRIKRGLASRGA
jgi:glycosyltransferase involved in cell wall biosynthesis